MRTSAVAFLAAIVASLVATWVVSFPDRAAAQGSQVYEKLRDQALNLTPADLGIEADSRKLTAYGIIMDMGLSDGTATIVAYASGDASVYTSAGGALIGGGLHPEVQEAARAWIRAAQDHLDAFEPAASFPLAADGHARFFILTNRGALTADGLEDELDAAKGELSPLWRLGQQLLDRLRAIPTVPAN